MQAAWKRDAGRVEGWVQAGYKEECRQGRKRSAGRVEEGCGQGRRMGAGRVQGGMQAG